MPLLKNPMLDKIYFLFRIDFNIIYAILKEIKDEWKGELKWR